MKVALVDDDAAVRSSLRLLLAGRGYHVDVFTGGQAVLDARLTDDYFCLLADYLMPDVDGITLLSELRMQGWAGPAMLITGHYDSSLNERATSAGYIAVFEKPLHSQQLIDAVAKLARG